MQVLASLAKDAYRHDHARWVPKLGTKRSHAWAEVLPVERSELGQQLRESLRRHRVSVSDDVDEDDEDGEPVGEHLAASLIQTRWAHYRSKQEKKEPGLSFSSWLSLRNRSRDQDATERTVVSTDLAASRVDGDRVPSAIGNRREAHDASLVYCSWVQAALTILGGGLLLYTAMSLARIERDLEDRVTAAETASTARLAALDRQISELQQFAGVFVAPLET